MKHPLFVGHFDVGIRSYNPKILKPIDLGRVVEILATHCDRELDGSLVIASGTEQSNGADSTWLGRIWQDDVLFEAGYLICPWLSAGINRKSVNFINELHNILGVQIYQPDDGAFLTPELLANA